MVHLAVQAFERVLGMEVSGCVGLEPALRQEFQGMASTSAVTCL